MLAAVPPLRAALLEERVPPGCSAAPQPRLPGSGSEGIVLTDGQADGLAEPLSPRAPYTLVPLHAAQRSAVPRRGRAPRRQRPAGTTNPGWPRAPGGAGIASRGGRDGRAEGGGEERRDGMAAARGEGGPAARGGEPRFGVAGGALPMAPSVRGWGWASVCKSRARSRGTRVALTFLKEGEARSGVRGQPGVKGPVRVTPQPPAGSPCSVSHQHSQGVGHGWAAPGGPK